MLHTAFAVFLIMLGCGQLIAVGRRLSGASLTGRYRRSGGLLGALLLALGGWLLPPTWLALLWPPLLALPVLALLLAGGSFIGPPPHPDEALFSREHPAHGGCRPVKIPDGAHFAPGLLLRPPENVPPLPAAVCVLPGAGDTKTSFKWRLVQSLLAQGLTVLTVDPPGHGHYRHRPLVYPEGLSTLPATLRWLHQLPGIEQVGVIGISLGGAQAVAALARQPTTMAAALVVVATPTRLNYSSRLFWGEVWRTWFGSPIVGLLRDITARQARHSWRSGGYRSAHTTSQLFQLLQPAQNLARLKGLPTLLVYSRRDGIAPPAQEAEMEQAAPWAEVVTSKKASHVMLTLEPAINRQIATWLARQLKTTDNTEINLKT